MIDTLLADLRYALRTLRQSPGFTLGVVLTLGLGIGANVTMFSVIDRMLFRPPPLLRDAGRTHRVYFATTQRGVEATSGGVEYARFVDLKNWTSSFARAAAFTEEDLAIGVGPDAREMRVAIVSASFFGFFDAPPAVGRYFTVAEDLPPTGTAVAVLSHAFWQTRYGGRSDVLGTTLQIGPTVYTIIGVAAEGFVGLWPSQQPVAFIPITSYAGSIAGPESPVAKVNFPTDTWWTTYNWTWASMLVQRKPGLRIAAADGDLTNAYLRSYAAQRSASPHCCLPAEIVRPRALAASVLSERGPNPSSFAKVVTWAGGVAVIVLLIACANVASLLLARALKRRREIAIRLSLGVSRQRLVSQLLTESLLLAVGGGAAGLLVAQWGHAFLRARFLANAAEVSVARDPRTLLFMGAAVLLAGLLTGIAPALQAWSGDLVRDLKAGAREGTHHRSPARVALMALQLALSVVLLVGAGLFVRSVQRVRDVPLGYDVDPVLLVDLTMRGAPLDSARQVALRHKLLETALAFPGVEHASLQVTVPFWNWWKGNIRVPGIDSVNRLGEFRLNAVTPDYFATLGTRILRGRGISAVDAQHAPGALVVSEAMAQRLWPGQDPIGKCVKLLRRPRMLDESGTSATNSDATPCSYVVGVAENIRSQKLSNDAGLFFYLSSAQWHPDYGGLFIRVRGDATRQAESIRRRLQALMPGATYVTVTPLREILGSQTSSWRLGATMFVVFGVLALAVAAIGLYGVIAYGVAQRTQEIGVRAALGAQVGDLVRLVLGEGLNLAVVGLAIGIALALIAGRWVGPLLFEESPRDPFVFAFVAAVLVGVAALASYLPARRAARVDPVVALRSE